jgi:hypothetical protein
MLLEPFRLVFMVGGAWRKEYISRQPERELAGRLSPRDPKFNCHPFVYISFVLDLPQHSRLLIYYK